jgi:hypothetical protein
MRSPSQSPRRQDAQTPRHRHAPTRSPGRKCRRAALDRGMSSIAGRDVDNYPRRSPTASPRPCSCRRHPKRRSQGRGCCQPYPASRQHSLHAARGEEPVVGEISQLGRICLGALREGRQRGNASQEPQGMVRPAPPRSGCGAYTTSAPTKSWGTCVAPPGVIFWTAYVTGSALRVRPAEGGTPAHDVPLEVRGADELDARGRPPCVRTLRNVHRALARLTRARPRLLARHFGEPVRPITVRGNVLVALSAMPRLAVAPVKRTRQPACSGLGHATVAALQLLPSEDIQICAQATPSAGQSAPRMREGEGRLRPPPPPCTGRPRAAR